MLFGPFLRSFRRIGIHFFLDFFLLFWNTNAVGVLVFFRLLKYIYHAVVVSFYWPKAVVISLYWPKIRERF